VGEWSDGLLLCARWLNTSSSILFILAAPLVENEKTASEQNYTSTDQGRIEFRNRCAHQDLRLLRVHHIRQAKHETDG
jgi:hypothetical protein